MQHRFQHLTGSKNEVHEHFEVAIMLQQNFDKRIVHRADIAVVVLEHHSDVHLIQIYFDQEECMQKWMLGSEWIDRGGEDRCRIFQSIASSVDEIVLSWMGKGRLLFCKV